MPGLRKKIEEATKGIVSTTEQEIKKRISRTLEYVFARGDINEISRLEEDVNIMADKYSNKRFPGPRQRRGYNRRPSGTRDYPRFKSEAEELLNRYHFIDYNMLSQKMDIPQGRSRETRSFLRRFVREYNLKSEGVAKQTAFYRAGKRPEFLSVGEAVRKFLAGKERVPADKIYREFKDTYSLNQIRGVLGKSGYRLNRDTNEFEIKKNE